MSIPKEPRQLMINLMYLVLTALLALNVSAEVMNAFFDLDKSLQTSNKLTKDGVEATKAGIQPLLEKKPKLQAPLNTGISNVNSEVNSFVKFIEDLKDQLIDKSGNKDGIHNDEDYAKGQRKYKPKGKKNKDITTRLLVMGTEDGGEPQGPIVEKMVGDLKSKLVEIYSNTVRNEDVMTEGKLSKEEVDSKINDIVSTLPLQVETAEEILAKSKDGKQKTWSEYKFKQMPLAAVLPALTKLQTDARNSEATIVNKLAELVGGREIKLNKFFPVINAEKGYVIKGEKFNATVQIGAYSSEFGENSTISVNGKRIALKDGVGEYSETATGTGKKTLKLTSNVVNPITGETFNETSTFEYEVGVRSATVSADKMNVFYIGVDNPVSVTVAGASSNEIKASGQGVSLKKVSGGNYVATATKPGPATINVSGGGLPNTPFKFRVKRIPDPMARLSKSSGGAMGNGEFKAQGGVGAFLDNFDFDAKCKIQGYNLTYVAKRQDPVESVNRGSRYNDKSKRLVNQAKPGDIFYFDNVKARCPGDSAGRKINSMVFKIK
ncbi:MAG: GldM family protein [Saprospiraceae bacterium]